MNVKNSLQVTLRWTECKQTTEHNVYNYYVFPPLHNSAASMIVSPSCEAISAPVAQNAEVTKTFEITVDEPYAAYYECTGDLHWLSGHKGRLAQCIKGKWTPILDICGEGKLGIYLAFNSDDNK